MGGALSAGPPSLNSGFCRRSEFIWRVLIFSVVFLTKLDTLGEEARNQTGGGETGARWKHGWRARGQTCSESSVKEEARTWAL